MNNSKNGESIEKINNLYAFISTKKYGDIIYHEQIERILNVQKELSKYGIYLKQVKDKLVSDSKILKAIPKIGYQILKPNQVSSYTYRKYMQRALKSYDYSQFILDNLETNNLTTNRKEEYNDVKMLNKKLKEVSEVTIKESKYYSRKDFYNNLDEEE